MQCMIENVPFELRERAQWVLWRYVQNDKGKWTKVLYQTKHPERKASSTNPATWSDFASTMALVTPEQGLGFVFSENDPYCGIDLDGCVNDGTIEPWAEQLMQRFPGYAEFSPSGRGIHLIGKGVLSKGWNQKPLEMYSQGRFFTCTGTVVPGRPTTIASLSHLEDFEQCIEVLSEALKTCPAFPALFSGDWSSYGSQSEADVGFTADLLRSGATTLEEVIAAVALSGLWRDKWERDDYQESTFRAAAKLYNEGQARPTKSPTKTKTDDGSLARFVAETLRDTLAFDHVGRVWRQHNGFVWSRVDNSTVLRLVEETLYSAFGETSHRQVRAVMALLQARMTRNFNSTPGLPMATQVFNLTTKETRPYTPDDDFTWQLPFDYEPEATCPTIERWLDGSSSKRAELLAFAKAVLIGYQDAEVYIEAVGTSGVGKSTYTNLLQALVGTENTVPSSFARLKANKRFETARFYGKRLLIFADEQAYVEDVELFKKLTSASDTIPGELKGVNEAFDFRFQGLVVVTANAVLKSSDKSNALGRRRVIVEFHKAEGEWNEKLMDFQEDGTAIGVFAGELPGFFNLLLNITPAEIKATLKTFGDAYKRALLETETLAVWCQQSLAHAPEAFLPIGTKEKKPYSLDYKFNPKKYAYTNYHKWMADNGYGDREILSSVKFSGRVADLLTNHVSLPHVEIKKGPEGMRIYGVRFREEYDPGIILQG